MTQRSPVQRATILALVAIGVALRLREYLANRSLWLDESYLALNLIERSFAGLVGTLDNGQAAPIGFLFAERLVITMFGSSEHALRALPLLARICAVVVFARLAPMVLGFTGTVFALVIFAVSEPLIYYAAEVKQYGVDAAVATIIWWTFTALRSRLEDNQWPAWTTAAVVGAVAMCVSHPAVFVVGGFAIYALTRAVLLRSRRAILISGAAGLVWLGTFLALYVVSLRFVSPELQTAWRGGAIPLMPSTSRHVTQYVDLVWTLGMLALGRQVLPLVTLSALVGIVALWKRGQPHVFWFAGTFALAWLASSIGKYPLALRLWLFLAPAVILLVGAGIEEIWLRTRLTFRVFAPLFVVLLLVYPLAIAGDAAKRPRGKEEIRPLLQHIERHYRDGDALYVYYAAQHAMRYYAMQGWRFAGPIKIGTMVVTSENRYQIEDDVDAIRGQPHVWVLFSHVSQTDGLNDETLFLHLLDRVGVRLDSVRTTGASLYLYDLSRAPVTR